MLDAPEGFDSVLGQPILQDGDGEMMAQDEFGGNVFGTDGEDDIDEDGEEDSVEDHYEAGEFAELELDEQYVLPPANTSSDRFGANWAWATAPGLQGTSAPGMLNGDDGIRNSARRVMRVGQRAPRPGAPNDVGSHPLLEDPQSDQHNSASVGQRLPRRRMGLRDHGAGAGQGAGWMDALEAAVGGGAMQFLEAVLSRAQVGEEVRLSITTAGDGRAPHVQLDGVPVQAGGALNSRVSAGLRTAAEDQPAKDPISALQEFAPMSTAFRWQQQASIVYGRSTGRVDRPVELTNELHNALLPDLWEREREEEKKQVEMKRELEVKREEERVKQAEEDAGKAAKAVEAEVTSAVSNPNAPIADVDMEDESVPKLELGSLEQGLADIRTQQQEGSSSESQLPPSTSTSRAEGEAGAAPSAVPTASQPRMTVMIRGREVDITESGIDPEFLEALPDDMREEIVDQHLRERHASTLTAGQNSNIAPEFLDALPPEIRAEVIQQELLTNRARARGAAAEARAHRSAQIEAGRNADSTEQAEGDQGGDDEDEPDQEHDADATIEEHPAGDRPVENSAKKAAPRDAIQLLDKPGIAALVRLLFSPTLDARTSGLHKVLSHLTENSKTRTELLNLLLTIVWDGTFGAAAVERSYAAMTAKVSKSFSTPLKNASGRKSTGVTPASVVPHTQLLGQAPMSGSGEEAAYLIALRCVDCLLILANNNEQVAEYFLRDDAKTTRKGKNKAGMDKQGTAPISTLLALLERPVILQHASLLDGLIAL